MAKESFEDQQVADILNQHYISIKIDREERPDIDHIYMTACQALTGQGGWPLSIFMTPEKKPFFAGTYFPKNDRGGMQGFISLIKAIYTAWEKDPLQLEKAGQQIVNAIDEPRFKESLEDQLIEKAFLLYKREFDPVYGGFGRAPKFPIPHQLFFLLRYWYKTKDSSALYMVEKTLDGLYQGGIYDHIGYGFCRYSIDERWLIPHFEKMLYDNALLAIAYLETYQVTKNKRYAQISEEIFTYILRDMTSAEGGFYCAEDADSEGVEGKFYSWTTEEIRKVLGEKTRGFQDYFNITQEGNFEGVNIPNLIGTEITEEQPKWIKECIEKLFQVRKQRVHPHKDDKILTSWNGLMIAALAMGARILKKEDYALKAKKAAQFIEQYLTREDGRLFARYRDGEMAFLAYAEDYTFLVWGLIELYQTTFEPKYLQRAIQLSQDLLQHFWDEKDGGLFVYGKDSEQLITKPKDIYDGATPSANSVAAMNFLRLAHLTGRDEFEEKAKQILETFASEINQYPKGYSFALTAVLFAESAIRDIIIVAPGDQGFEAKQMISSVQENFHPFTLSVVSTQYNNKDINEILKIKEYQIIDNKPTAYVCQNFSCLPAITEIKKLQQIIDQ